MKNFIAANKIFLHPDRIRAYLNRDTVRPISVKMRLTDDCNLNCGYCSYKGNLNHGEMAPETFDKTVQTLEKMGVKSIVLTGGEPTFYAYFYEALQELKERGFDIALITNGLIYHPEYSKNLTWVRFSLDTVDPEAYKKMRGSDQVELAMSNIKMAISARNPRTEPTIGVQAVVGKHNFDHKFDMIKDVIDFAREAGADYVQIRPLENYKYSVDEMMIINGNLDVIRNSDCGIKVITTDYKWAEVMNGYRKEYAGCPSADFMGMVDVKGDFYICCAMTNDPTAFYGSLVTDKAANIITHRKAVQNGFDFGKCTAACQGSLLNQTLQGIRNIKHINFI